MSIYATQELRFVLEIKILMRLAFNDVNLWLVRFAIICSCNKNTNKEAVNDVNLHA